DWAAENASVLRQQGLEIALTTYGLSDKKKFRSNLRQALDRGLSENDALAGLTTIPASLCGVQNRLGTIEAGKLANLTVVEGAGYFQPDAKVREVWIAGRVYRPPAEEPKAEKTNQAKATKPSSSEEETPPKAKEEPERKASSPKPETPKVETNKPPAKSESEEKTGDEKSDK